MLLIAIDFDHTIVNGQTHLKLMLSKEAKKDRQWEQIKDLPVIGEPGEWKSILENLIKADYSVCIVSFNSHAHIALPTNVLTVDRRVTRQAGSLCCD